jgi:Protein of unknown function (DUF2808)
VKYFWSLFIITVFSIGVSGVLRPSANAIELADGTTHFLNPPRLLGVLSSQDGTYIWDASYYFTLKLPENAGEPLRKVVIVQEGGLGRPLFDTDNTEAFEGTRRKPGKRLPLQEVNLDPEATALTVLFDPPVPPGKTFTIRLNPVRNPEVAGTYLYGVTAFPVGKRPYGQYIGVGQIRIYDGNLD